MKARLINRLKHSKILYSICVFFYRSFWMFISVFIKVNSKKIIFTSFGGRKFDDSPYALFCEMKKDHFFDDYDFVWAFADPKKFCVSGARVIKIDTFSFFKELLSSKIWISNTGIDRGIGLKKNNVVRVETWHGTPIKKICGEENAKKQNKKSKKNEVKGKDIIRCAQSDFDKEIFSRIFDAPKNNIFVCDLPRNDSLIQKMSSSDKEIIKKELGIDTNKKVILYMPTFREYQNSKHYDNLLAPPMNIKKWKKELGNEYVLLFRAHYVVTKILNIQFDDFVIDVSNYEHLNDLYQIADVLISDYSSSYFDFSILKKPMLCFAYDLEEYSEKRGLYLNLSDDLGLDIKKKEDEIINQLKTLNYNEDFEYYKVFRDNYVVNPGNSCKTIIEKVKQRIL